MSGHVLLMVAGLDIGGLDGGAERAGVELCLELAKQGQRADLMAFWRSRTSAESYWLQRCTEANVTVHFAAGDDMRRNSLDFFRALPAARASIHAGRYQICHAHHEGGALAALFARRLSRHIAVVRTAHLPSRREWGVGLSALLLRGVFSQVAFPLLVDAETSISEHYARTHSSRIIARLMGRRTRVIPNATSAALRTPQQKRALHTFTIGSVGRLVHSKRVDMLVDAVVLLRKRRSDVDVRCLIVGDGPMRAQLEEKSSHLNVSKSITFAGQVTDVSELLAQMDVFAFPSEYEGLPTALMEAAAFGIPIVASDIAGNRLILRSTDEGWHFPVGDLAALVNCLDDVLANPNTAIQRAERAQSALEPYTLASVSKAYVNLYDDLLRTHGDHRA
jgi:glycosyltransferase involved in cell wall biosynthesis